MLIKGRAKVGIKKLKNLKEFIDYSQLIDDVNENLEDYNPSNERKVLIAFDDKIPNKRELQEIASNHSSDIDFKDFIKLYKDYTKEQYSFISEWCYFVIR